MRVDLAPCIILHRRAYRDTSLIVEAFSREHGRIGLLARGARRPRARWAGLLEPLGGLRLSWSGRGDLKTLTQAEAAGRGPELAGDALYAGFYVAELTLRTTARLDPHPGLFDHVARTLARLGQGEALAPVLRAFERDLLAELGYGLMLEADADTGAPVQAAARYYYDPQAGIRGADGRAGAQELEISGDSLLALAGDRLDTRSRQRDARRLLAAALAPHLGARALKSAQTLRAMRRLRDRPDGDHGDGS